VSITGGDGAQPYRWGTSTAPGPLFTFIGKTAPMADSEVARRDGEAGPDRPVRAAGVVVVRDSDSGPEVVVIHRGLRADWSLPKGKVEPGEHAVVAAVRECDEETGLVPILGPPLTTQEYVALGSPKVVDYWAARVGSDEGFAPDDEVEEIAWLPAEAAASRLTYPRDADLIREAVALPSSSPLILLRHTQALKRADFKGKVDAERPLSGKGRSQAKALVPLLAAYGIEWVHSSDATRCRETVKRYAKSVDTSVQLEPSLSEEAHADRPKRAARRMRELLLDPRPMVVCTHRPVLPTLVEVIAGLRITGPRDLDPKLPPGGFLVVHRHFPDNAEDPIVLGVERHSVSPE
jgi:8-oxo-dGTP pyrophosphatase MutT (NUDIX family)/phosphohistidine phosphatase SixA